MASEVKCYLPKYNQVTIWFLRDLFNGNTLRIPSEKAAHLHVPMYEDLDIEDILNFAKENNHGAAMKYLPRDKLDMVSLLLHVRSF